MDKNIIDELEKFYREKSFNTRGIQFSKKMWRDGYNKALQDVLNHFKLLSQKNTQERIETQSNRQTS